MKPQSSIQTLDLTALPLRGRLLIEASAGTGKTFTLAALYLRLVLQLGGQQAFLRPLAPQDILVVTFTNAATAELRERIRQRLLEGAAALRGRLESVSAADPVPTADPVLERIFSELDEPQWAVAARQLELAAASMDEAAIHTIHGWCQRMLGQHAFASGSAFGLTLAPSAQTLLLEAAQDYWRHWFYPLGADLLEPLLNMVKTPDDLAGAIRSLGPAGQATAGSAQATPAENLAVPAYLAPLTDWSNKNQALEAQAKAAWLQDEAAILDWFEKALQQKGLHGSSHKPAQVRQQLQQLQNWARGLSRLDSDLLKLAPAGMKLNKNWEAPPLAGLAGLNPLFDHHRARLALQKRLPEQVFTHASQWCHQRVEQQKQRLALQTFDDLLIRLDQALQGPQGERLAQLIRQQFPVALIDEFQDTDPVQYRIFRRIYHPASADSTALLLIGDPKQAIYSFRGADIFTYLQAREDTGGHHFTLDVNYRSVAPLVAAVNSLFEQGNRFPQGAFLLPQAIPFYPAKAQGKTRQLWVAGQPQAALTCWLPSAEQTPNKATYLACYAEATASHIDNLLRLAQQGQAGFAATFTTTFTTTTTAGPLAPLQAADIAILVRSGREAAIIQAALAKRHIRSAFLSDKNSVFSSPEADDLYHWLQAIHQPDQEALLRVALATPLLNQPLSRLDLLHDDSLRWDANIETFRHYKHRWQQQGPLPMLRRLLHDFDLAAGLLQSVAGERSLTNLLQLAELLQEASAQLDGEQALLRYFAEQIRQAHEGGQDTPDERHIQRLESDAAVIQVITLHKSKGLQYPLVFLPFVAAARPTGKQDLPLRYFDPQRQQQIRCFDPQDEDVARADQERLAEDLRLLYVALTRAEYACWLGLSPLGTQSKKDGYQCQLKDAAIGYLLKGGDPLPDAALRQALDQLQQAQPAIRVCAAPEAPLHLSAPPFAQQESSQQQPLQPARSAPMQALKSRRDWWMSSYSGLFHGDARSESAAAANLLELSDESGESPMHMPAQLTPHQFPKGAVAGLFLHDLLEAAAKNGFARLTQDDQLAAFHRLIETRCQARGWEIWVPCLQAWLGRILQHPLPRPQNTGVCSLLELTRTQLQAEMAFMFAGRAVSVEKLDQLIRQHLLPGQARPPLQAWRINGMLKGFIDLVFEWQGRYYLLDYKSNHLGESAGDYHQTALQQALLAHRYDLQYSLYSLALHRLLRLRLPSYDYQQHFGGVYYLFLRGMGDEAALSATHEPMPLGVYFDQPPQALIESLDRCFRGEG